MIEPRKPPFQGDINAEQKNEVTALQERVEQVKSEYQGQLAEYRKLLEMRAARIQKLEGQLRDSAYGNLRRQVTALLSMVVVVLTCALIWSNSTLPSATTFSAIPCCCCMPASHNANLFS